MIRLAQRALLPTLAAAALLAAGCGNAGLPGASGQARTSVFSANAAPDTRVMVELRFGTADKLHALAKAGVDLFENVDAAKGTVGATLTPRTEAIVRKLGVTYSVTQALDGLKGPMPAGYATVEAIGKDLAALATKYPGHVHLTTIGKSVQGRPIWAVNITSKPGQNLPAVRITTGVHARELPPVEVGMRFIHLLAESYGSDPQVTKAIDGRDIWIVPVWNPDGRTKVEQGSSMWRKNVGGAEGVDINRNADDHWEGGNSSSWADDYHGPSAFSEPETQAMRDFCNRNKFAAAMDIHCYAGMILWPPGFSKDYSKDEAAFKTIGERMAKPIGYKAGTIARTIYATFGDFATWEYYAKGTLSFAVELAVSGFNPPYAQVEKQWSDWKPNLLYFVDAAGSTRTTGTALDGLTFSTGR